MRKCFGGSVMFDLQAELYNKIIILRLTGDILLADVVEFNQQMKTT